MRAGKWFLSIALIAVLVAQLAACAAQSGASSKTSSSSTKKDPITGEYYPKSINVGVIEGGPESAILVKENYFKGIDAKVKVSNYASGADINKAVISKKVDLSSFGSYPIALGIANTIDYKAIFVPYIEGGNIEALVVKKNENIKKVADLKGKKIATPFGTTSHYALLNTLKQAGLSGKDATIVDMAGQDIVAAWSRNDIDAAYIWSPALDKNVANGGEIIANDGDLIKKGVTIPEIAVARTAFAAKYPTLVSQYVKALVKVYDLTQKNPKKATQDIADWEGVTTKNAESQINDNIWVSPEDQTTDNYFGGKNGNGQLAKTLKTIAKFHKQQGDLSYTPGLSTFEKAINTSYLKRALKK